MKQQKCGGNQAPKYKHCQINYTSSNLAFILPSRKAINNFVNENSHHLKEKLGRKQTPSCSEKRKSPPSNFSPDRLKQKRHRKITKRKTLTK